MSEVGGGIIEVVKLAEPRPLVADVEEPDHEMRRFRRLRRSTLIFMAAI